MDSRHRQRVGPPTPDTDSLQYRLSRTAYVWRCTKEPTKDAAISLVISSPQNCAVLVCRQLQRASCSATSGTAGTVHPWIMTRWSGSSSLRMKAQSVPLDAGLVEV